MNTDTHACMRFGSASGRDKFKYVFENSQFLNGSQANSTHPLIFPLSIPFRLFVYSTQPTNRCIPTWHMKRSKQTKIAIYLCNIQIHVSKCISPYKFPFSFPFLIPYLLDAVAGKTCSICSVCVFVCVCMWMCRGNRRHIAVHKLSSFVSPVLNNHTLSLFAICFIIHKYFHLMNAIAYTYTHECFSLNHVHHAKCRCRCRCHDASANVCVPEAHTHTFNQSVNQPVNHSTSKSVIVIECNKTLIRFLVFLCLPLMKLKLANVHIKSHINAIIF